MRSWKQLLAPVSLTRVGPVVPDPPAGAPGGDAASTIREALEATALDGLVAAAAARSHPVTVVVNDGHRVTDTRAFLDACFAMIDRGPPGARDAEFRLLVAAGTHRAGDGERRAHEERILGSHRARFSRIGWHDADDEAAIEDVGGYGFNRWVTGEGLCIACGSMEPHYFAGITGAHKTLTVGVMSRASIARNHAGAMEEGSAGLRLAGNPVHEGIVAAVRALESTDATLLALNEVIVGGSVVAATAGHPLDALDLGVETVRRSFSHTIAAPVDLVVARVEPPLDRDVYQADKGMKNTEVAVRDGGLLLIEAACAGGIGIDHFVDLLRDAPTHDAALAAVDARGYRLGDHKAVKLRALTDRRGVRVGIVSALLDPSLGEPLGMRVFADRESAASWARAELGHDAAGLEVEDAGNVTLEVRAR